MTSAIQTPYKICLRLLKVRLKVQAHPEAQRGCENILAAAFLLAEFGAYSPDRWALYTAKPFTVSRYFWRGWRGLSG